VRGLALAVTAAVIFAGTAFEAKATSLIGNGGFETGDFTDWTVNNSGGCCIQVQSSALGYGPNSGTFFAEIGTTARQYGRGTEVFGSGL
jgi:hypothetical protein